MERNLLATFDTDIVCLKTFGVDENGIREETHYDDQGNDCNSVTIPTDDFNASTASWTVSIIYKSSPSDQADVD